MSWAWVNGRFTPLSRAVLSIEDRGLLFADAVYEVVCVARGRAVDIEEHWERLWRSMREISLQAPCSRAVLTLLLERLVVLNRLKEGMVYLQISRGSAPREHAFPDPSVPANLFLTTRHAKPPPAAPKMLKAVSLPDTRWRRVDIKTTNLLANCLALEQAKQRGGDEVLFYEPSSDHLLEASKSNLWLVCEDGKLLTPPRTTNILGGVTRLALLRCAQQQGLSYLEQSFTREQAKAGRELFLTNSTGFVTIVSTLDDCSIGRKTKTETKTKTKTEMLRQRYPLSHKLYDLYVQRLGTL